MKHEYMDVFRLFRTTFAKFCNPCILDENTVLVGRVNVFGITYFNEPNIFLLCAFIFGLGFGAATPLMTACYLRIFGAHNLGKARGISSPIISPLQPLGILITSILIGFQDTYFVAFNIMGFFALTAVILASQIQEP